MFPELIKRPRRLRNNNIRDLVRENQLSVDDLIYPLFVVNGEGIKEEIPSMPGNYHWSLDLVMEEVKNLVDLGIKAIILFGIPEFKDEKGSSAWIDDGIVQRACQKIKEEYPDLLVITDVCLCQYTDHGHCGVLEDGRVKNDPTLELLAKTAVSHAEAGADMVAPSDMMDGRVGAIRKALDENEFSNISIMAYSAKYASSFYGPFRDAAHSAPEEGDRRSYQMDPANSKEAVKETALDIEEGADIIMVKPALSYLDIIQKLNEEFDYPVAAYNVSGEYSLIKAAAEKGWINEQEVVLEMLLSMKRAGTDLILTYFAKDVAKWLREE
ncbi:MULTISPECIES: porphobilinogen synthase [unclassified Candidatus Frackibacter]|uniref:porphobilinogen synthase n=1 Tax=unclassified Candidatus Frackibacter TaxID=2648818 RepID=UPI00079BBC15|nr:MULTISPECIES: porphobilinogen synthase [unclassified Candidatus Frackibacter]KXS44739.1 MAG: porphobilinogen synthase [Candidatus Frackibacter sp. T328-2]SDC41180.1 porphobilinogen synthase [Candidatus Frackibacter sp. WG11]SEM59742.1 porphobilinogen synthase [Candidatus Frackibacter sp. WG12]SFL62340.1 porphobilinogen synthase [Candidatus Frackibacter sp. WG13]